MSSSYSPGLTSITGNVSITTDVTSKSDNVVLISGSKAGAKGTTVLYTVPAGKKLYFYGGNFWNVGTNSGQLEVNGIIASVKTAPATVDWRTPLSLNLGLPMLLTAGQTIAVNLTSYTSGSIYFYGTGLLENV